MTINPKKINLYIDIIFCVVVLPLVLSLIPIERMFANATIFTVVLIIFLYAVYFLFRRIRVPALIMKKRYTSAIFFILMLIVSTFFLAHFPLSNDFVSRIPESDIARISAHRAQRVWFLFLVVSGFSLVIDLTFELFHQVLARKDVEEARNKAELSLYKAQINPHFLFNSLNTIYGMIVSRSESTEEAFIKFSDMLKYMYDHPTDDLIDVEREFEYIGNYIDFQELRHNGRTHVEWNSDVDDQGASIPPMLLITFVENAFKYGSSSSQDCRIKINAHVSNRMLVFETVNQIMRKSTGSNGGIGIKNCRNRLDLLYPDRYTLDIKEDNDYYHVKLTIEL